MSSNRVFIFHETSDNFRSFDFAGAAQASENWDPSLTTIRGAAADAAGNIFVLDLSANPAIVRRYDASQARQANLDITMNDTGAYEGIAVTDTHLVALRGEGLQYYDLTTRAYVSSMDVTLPSRTNPEYYSGICRAGDYLFLVTHNDSTYQPRIYKRNLDGSAVSDWAGQPSTTALTIFATNAHVVTVRKNGGHWDRWDFNGVQTTTLNTIGSGLWQASYTTYEQLSIEAIDEQFIARNTEDYDLVIDITGNPDTVEAKGHMEGFIQDWDAISGQLHIKSDKVTRLISGVNWDIDARRGMEQLMGQIAYNVIQAAPIFETLGTIHLYRGVPINFDIVIQNIPPLLIPNARLLGLKSDLVDYGVSVKGEIGTTDNFTINTGNVRIIVPSESGGEDTVYDFPYQIEAGGPPAIGTPEFAARGAYGSLEVADVTHALGYEWTLGEGDEATWNFFSDSRTVIDPATVEVTPGQLNVTITFPNIAGASSYEYQLVSEDSETPWKRFTGTLSNNMITTIIPDLEDGVQYKLRLRVASPWVGTPTAITVYGGRIVYCIDNANVRAADDVLYLFHTGVASGGTVTRIKRVLLPTTLENGERLAVDSDQNVYVFDKASSERSLFVFDAAVIANASDGDRISASRRNPLPVGATTAAAIVGGMKIYDGELYVHISNNSGSFRNGVRVVSTSLADGQTLTSLRSAMLASYREGLTVLQDRIYAVCTFGGIPGAGLGVYERDFGQSNIPLSTRTGLRSAAGGNVFYTSMEGLKVIDADVYIVFGGTRPALRRYRFDQAADRYTEDRSIGLPVGLLKPHGLDML